MEYQEITNLLDSTPNKTTKFRTKNWVEINDDSHGKYDTNSQINFKTSMLRTSLWDYNNDAYTLVSGTITITGEGDDAAARQADEKNKWVIFKNCAPFTDCISGINITQINNVKYADVVMPMFSLIEYSDSYSKNIRKFVAILQK